MDKKRPAEYRPFFLCTQSRSRTGTSVTSLVFETNASTNSAIWANTLLIPYRMGCKYADKNDFLQTPPPTSFKFFTL